MKRRLTVTRYGMVPGFGTRSEADTEIELKKTLNHASLDELRHKFFLRNFRCLFEEYRSRTGIEVASQGISVLGG